MRTVRRPLIISSFAALVAISAQPLSSGIATAAETKQTQTETARKPPRIDPKAIGALRTMGAFLCAQKSFTIRTNTNTDYVTDDGQKLTASAQGTINVQRPDHLRAEVVSDSKHRQLFYDGKKFTIFSPKLGFYATTNAPPTIGELADVLSVRYGLDLPLVDLFRWGTTNPDLSDIDAAMYVGPAKINGIQTDHYAFRQEGVDWQIWIQRGATPVPRKLVLTTTDTPARPEHAIAMTWELNAKQDLAMFTFVPPEKSTKIVLEDLNAPPPEFENTTRAKRSAGR